MLDLTDDAKSGVTPEVALDEPDIVDSVIQGQPYGSGRRGIVVLQCSTDGQRNAAEDGD